MCAQVAARPPTKPVHPRKPTSTHILVPTHKPPLYQHKSKYCGDTSHTCPLIPPVGQGQRSLHLSTLCKRTHGPVPHARAWGRVRVGMYQRLSSKNQTSTAKFELRETVCVYIHLTLLVNPRASGSRGALFKCPNQRLLLACDWSSLDRNTPPPCAHPTRAPLRPRIAPHLHYAPLVEAYSDASPQSEPHSEGAFILMPSHHPLDTP